MSAPAQEPSVPWYRSIRFRLVAAAVVVEVAMLSLLLANSYRLVSEALESQTRARLEALAPLLDAALAGRVFQRDHSEIAAIIRQLVRSHSTEIRYIVVFDRRGEVMADAGEVPPGLRDKDAPEDRSVAEAMADMTYDTAVPLTLLGNRVGSARFGLSLADLVALRGNVLRQSLGIALSEILLSLLLLTLGGYLVTRHIASLVAATRRVASADYSTPIQIADRDEIGVLAENFNRMAAVVQSRIDALAESEMRFRAIFDAAGDAFFIHDAESGRLLDVNRRMCEMYACTREQALSAPIDDFCSGVPPYTGAESAAMLRLARDAEPQSFDWLARRFDGEHFWVEVNLRLARIGAEDRVIALVRDISERKRYQSELEYLAHHDTLTKLPNRVLLADRMRQAMAQTLRSGRLLAVAYLDLDGFKPVNDALGHEVGDRLLVQVAERVREAMRAGDTACRLGGDEFALLLRDIDSVEECEQIFRRLLDTIAAPYRFERRDIRISASIGITLYPRDDAAPETLMRHADEAMYLAKQAGRDRFHLYEADGAAAGAPADGAAEGRACTARA